MHNLVYEPPTVDMLDLVYITSYSVDMLDLVYITSYSVDMQFVDAP